MGGQPLLALNIVCFPSCLDPGILRDILRGGAEKPKAGALLVGGHSLMTRAQVRPGCDRIVKPEEVWSNAGAAPGDVLVPPSPSEPGFFSLLTKLTWFPGLTLLR